MRFTARILLLVSLAAMFVHAQTQTKTPPFTHIVVIVQENRTPDNLFGGSPAHPVCGVEDPFEAGVDIDNGGPNEAAGAVTCLTPMSIPGNGIDLDHTHKPGWINQYDGGKMDGACLKTYPSCPQYTFVPKSDDQPYFDIATKYGFANYMFSTQEGPSFPAHQFLFGGSSAPVYPGDPNQLYKYFVAENSKGLMGSGCPATGSQSQFALWVDPTGLSEIKDPNDSECYDRNTLVTFQDSSGMVHDRTSTWAVPQPAWKYYVPTQTGIHVVWNAPQDDPQICYFASTGGGTACGSNNSTEYSTHVDVAKKNNMQSAPILTDIQNCQLPAISWVIPDELWSDHPDQGELKDAGLGPSWVADIVDAIGNSYANSGGKCDYWGYGTGSIKPEPTAIFSTWDDWGGFYDHVPPPFVYQGTGSPGNWNCTAPNGWGCGYVYGFRVPLLVVSNWTPQGYVSGAIPSPGAQGFQHDFGSILAFIENNFTQQGLNLPPIAPQTPVKYTYADQNTLDAVYNTEPAIPLWDFFQGPQRGFATIAPLQTTQDANFFMSYYQTQQPDGTYPQPTGPEDGDPDD